MILVKCDVCSKDIEGRKNKHKRNYCSTKCRQKIYRDLQILKNIKKGDYDSYTVRKIKKFGFKVTVVKN